MIAAMLALCGATGVLCIVSVVLHLRTLRRLEVMARSIERDVVPYLAVKAAAAALVIEQPAPLRTPETVIADACSLATRLREHERKVEDLALGPTQNLTAEELSRPR
jgi:hypothetical protein